MDKSGVTIENEKPKNCGFGVKWVLITPNVASEMLTHNSLNRNITSARVKELANMMKRGLFKSTHQGIAFDENGELLDGQHRLAAIVKSKCSVHMLVSTNLPSEARLFVDIGKSRTALAISKVTGRKDKTYYHTVARILKYGPVQSTQAHVAPSELFSLVDNFIEGINFVDSCLPSGVDATILSVVIRAFYSTDSEEMKRKLKRFVEVYKTGVPANEKEASAAKLKMFVLTTKQQKDNSSGNELSGHVKGNRRLYLYQATESALTDFINGYETKVLKPSKNEKFPLPSELDGWNPPF